MNKKILSIFALIMALSFAVSCSNEDKSGAGGNNGGGNPTVVTKDTIATAVKLALGDTLQVATTGSKTIKTDATAVVLSDSEIAITITDKASITTTTDADISDTEASLNALKNAVKTALTAQGLVIDGDITFAKDSSYTTGQSLPITVTATSIKPSTDTTKYTLPAELKDKASITITLTIVVGGSGNWTA